MDIVSNASTAKAENRMCTVLGRRTRALSMVVRILLVFVAVPMVNAKLSGQSHPISGAIWPAQEPGPYAVGFQIRREFDRSRTFRRDTDFFGKPVSGETARPLQISIWYPAATDGSQAQMKYGTYYRALAGVTDFSEHDQEQLQRVVAEHKNILLMEWRVEPDRQDLVLARLDSVFNEDAHAFADAPFHAGRFPLILHMPGYNGHPLHHAPLFEFLASFGYVVVAVPNMGMYTRNIENELLSIEVQARDLEFLLSLVKTLPVVDTSRVGTTGMSWGGMSNVLFAQRNFSVDAVLTLDGAITMPVELDLIEQIPGYSHVSFHPAYLQLLVNPNHAQFRPKDLRFFEALRYSDAYSVQFDSVGHDDFAPGVVRLRNLSEQDSDRVEHLERFTTVLYRYTLAFFDAFLKGNEATLKSLSLDAVAIDGANWISAKWTSKAALPIPPSEAEFVQIIRRDGAAKATEVFQQVSEYEPELKLISSRRIGPLYMEAFDDERYEEALEICRLWTLGEPQSVGPHFSMARIYLALERTEEAVAAYRKVLEIAPEGRSAERARSAIRELTSG